MKKILLFLLMLPLFIFCQSERTQKQSYRSGGSGYSPRSYSTSPRSYTPSYSQPSVRNRSSLDYSESESKLRYRNDRNYGYQGDRSNQYYYRDNRSRRYYGPYVTWDEWYFHNPYRNSYSFWRPYYWYDNWGYRWPGRIYYYNDDVSRQPDTVRVERPNVTMGIQYSVDEIGGFITIGNKVYFIAEYQHTYQRDASVYYDNITTDVVLPWNDKQLKDIKKASTIYVGLGKRLGRIGVHGALGFTKENLRYQYLDETYILSNNGKYSFPNYKDNSICAKLGVLYDFSVITGKVDYDPIKKAYTFGLGVNF